MEISKQSVLTSIEFIKNIRDKVEKDTTTQKYNMEEFRLCVLGVHHFDGEYWASRTHKTAAEILGLDPIHVETLFSDSWCSTFDNQRVSLYNQYEWLAMRIFTSNIGYTVSKEDWLKISQETIIQLEMVAEELE